MGGTLWSHPRGMEPHRSHPHRSHSYGQQRGYWQRKQADAKRMRERIELLHFTWNEASSSDTSYTLPRSASAPRERHTCAHISHTQPLTPPVVRIRHRYNSRDSQDGVPMRVQPEGSRSEDARPETVAEKIMAEAEAALARMEARASAAASLHTVAELAISEPSTPPMQPIALNLGTCTKKSRIFDKEDISSTCQGQDQSIPDV